jgi:2-dehydro-3-deoxyphosphooctonate aldolase (KDO 8-P synthase)
MIYDSSKLLLVAGPSLLEGERITFAVAQALRKLQDKYASELKVVFKSSFDKPNRTSLYSARGEGLEAGLALLSEVKDRYGLPLLTDVHERHQVPGAAAVCDVLQIPSLLCRQTDLMVAIAKSGATINLRKGPYLSPGETLEVAEKIETCHANELWITERGYCFGYDNLVLDLRVLPILRHAECPLLVDLSTPSPLPAGVGLPKALGVVQFVSPLARAAVAAGADGLYLDLHPEPENALADNALQLPLPLLDGVVADALKVWRALRS